MATSIIKLNEVMRNSKMYAQTKALYSYLWVRCDKKSGIAYPSKMQMINEINLNETMLNQCLGVLIKTHYIKETSIKKIDENGNEYTIKAYDLS